MALNTSEHVSIPRPSHVLTSSSIHATFPTMKTKLSLRLDKSIIKYFKRLSSSGGIPYQTLINAALCDAVSLKWGSLYSPRPSSRKSRPDPWDLDAIDREIAAEKK